jgi:hypothetical protein
MVEAANTLADLRLWDGKATRFSLRAIFFFGALLILCVWERGGGDVVEDVFGRSSVGRCENEGVVCFFLYCTQL